MTAGDTAPDVFGANLYGLYVNTLLGKDLLHFSQGDGSISSNVGAAVDHQNFHVDPSAVFFGSGILICQDRFIVSHVAEKIHPFCGWGFTIGTAEDII